MSSSGSWLVNHVRQKGRSCRARHLQMQRRRASPMPMGRSLVRAASFQKQMARKSAMRAEILSDTRPAEKAFTQK